MMPVKGSIHRARVKPVTGTIPDGTTYGDGVESRGKNCQYVCRVDFEGGEFQAYWDKTKSWFDSNNVHAEDRDLLWRHELGHWVAATAAVKRARYAYNHDMAYLIGEWHDVDQLADYAQQHVAPRHAIFTRWLHNEMNRIVVTEYHRLTYRPRTVAIDPAGQAIADEEVALWGMAFELGTDPSNYPP
jgi:hypothetical protein